MLNALALKMAASEKAALPVANNIICVLKGGKLSELQNHQTAQYSPRRGYYKNNIKNPAFLPVYKSTLLYLPLYFKQLGTQLTSVFVMLVKACEKAISRSCTNEEIQYVCKGFTPES